MNEAVTAAVELELRNSINKDLVGYCDRLGSGRMLEMAESYGSSADVVEMADLLLSKGIIVIFSGRMRRALDAEHDKAAGQEGGKYTEWLDELESKLKVPEPNKLDLPKVRDMFRNNKVEDRMKLNEELKRKANLDKMFDTEGD